MLYHFGCCSARRDGSYQRLVKRLKREGLLPERKHQTKPKAAADAGLAAVTIQSTAGQAAPTARVRSIAAAHRKARLHRAADALHDACIEFARRYAAWRKAGRPEADLEDSTEIDLDGE